MKVLLISVIKFTTGFHYMGEPMELFRFWELFLIFPAIGLICLFLTKHRKWHGMVSAVSCGTCGLALLGIYFFYRGGFADEMMIDGLDSLIYVDLVSKLAFFCYILLSVAVVIIGFSGSNLHRYTTSCPESTP